MTPRAAAQHVNFVRPAAFAVLVAVVTAAIMQLAQTFLPNLSGTYIVVMCVVAGLEGLYSPGLLKSQNVRGSDTLKFHAIELIALLLLLKLAGSAPARFLPDLLSLDIRTIAGAILLLAFWLSGLDTARDFADLDAPPEPIDMAGRDYVPPSQRLIQRFFAGGIVLLAVVGLLNLRHSPIGGLVLNVLVYFLTGLILMSQIRLDATRREWKSLGLNPSEEVARPWVRSATVLIGLAALVAFVLPTQYMLGMLDVLREILGVISVIVMVILTVLGWLLMLPFRLLMGQPAGRPEVIPQQPPLALAASSGTGGLLALLPKLILLAVVGYIVYTYLRDNPEARALLKSLRIVQLLRQLWAALRRQVDDLAGSLSAQIPRRLPRWLRARVPALDRPFGFVRLNALSPRERIRYFYLSTLRRAGDQGIPRAPDQTPFEYETILDTALPEAQSDAAALTDAFVEAHYSQHPVDQNHVQSVQAHWQQLRHTLQQAKRQKESDDSAPKDKEA